MLAKNFDKVLCGLAGLALLGTTAWAVLQRGQLSHLGNPVVVPSNPGDVYQPTELELPVVQNVSWADATPGARGEEWLYDVFTPPVIYYNRISGRFTVTPPDVPRVEDPTVQPMGFGVRLVEVRADQYRLQLVGYVGTDENARGNFENVISGETSLGRAGKRFEDLGITVRSFSVERVRTVSEGSMPVIDIVATAVIHDEQTDEEITLTNKERRIKGVPIVTLALGSNSEERTEIPVGSTWSTRYGVYQVVSAQLSPPSAEVVRLAGAGGTTVTEVLVPTPEPVPGDPGFGGEGFFQDFEVPAPPPTRPRGGPAPRRF